MKKLVIVAAVMAAAGCTTTDKIVDANAKGMYVGAKTQTVAIGEAQITTIPGDKEALVAHYSEDTAWLAPSIKTHEFDIFLAGTNSVAQSSVIIASICEAFKSTAVQISSVDAGVAATNVPTAFTTIEKGAAVDADYVSELGTIAKTAVNALASKKTASAAASDCSDGSCEEPVCEGGVCEE